ncbi:MAG: lysophospholipid acyltransferase family protein [Candidatus Spyradosoma sp.]
MKELFTDKLVYSLIYYSARAFMNTFGRLDVHGEENIPEGGCLFAGNHMSFIDPPLIGCCIPHEMFFLARKTLNDNPVLARVLPYCNVIPVDRDGGSDVAAFKKMFRVLREGHAILVFPEGTRSKDGKLGKAQGGAGLIACKARVPVVPVRLFGTNQVLQRGTFLPKRANLTVCFGKPMSPEEFDPGKDCPDRFREASRRVMARIAAMEEPAPSKY